MRLWLATLLLGVSSLAWAQDKFPQRNVEVILPYAAGGGVDAMGRAFAREAARITGQSWVVVNRDGGAGVIGFSALTRAPADGHTLVFSPASPLTNAPFLTKTMPFRNDLQLECSIRGRAKFARTGPGHRAARTAAAALRGNGSRRAPRGRGTAGSAWDRCRA